MLTPSGAAIIAWENTSSTAGPMTPNSVIVPPEGADLYNVIAGWLCGLADLPGVDVRPRWQPEPPNIPDDSIDWLAFGINRRVKDTFAAIVHNPSDVGSDELRRHEILYCLASFYGPNADLRAEMVSDGAQIPQNNDPLSLNSMGLVECGELTAVPELLKEKWLYRIDVPFSIRRQVVRMYSVQNILSYSASAHSDVITVTI